MYNGAKKAQEPKQFPKLKDAPQRGTDRLPISETIGIYNC